MSPPAVIPAKAGIQFFSNVPQMLDASLRWDDEKGKSRRSPGSYWKK
jgi:hypothetical protein